MDTVVDKFVAYRVSWLTRAAAGRVKISRVVKATGARDPYGVPLFRSAEGMILAIRADGVREQTIRIITWAGQDSPELQGAVPTFTPLY
jgi:hypothetical protein